MDEVVVERLVESDEDGVELEEVKSTINAVKENWGLLLFIIALIAGAFIGGYWLGTKDGLMNS